MKNVFSNLSAEETIYTLLRSVEAKHTFRYPQLLMDRRHQAGQDGVNRPYIRTLAFRFRPTAPHTPMAYSSADAMYEEKAHDNHGDHLQLQTAG